MNLTTTQVFTAATPAEFEGLQAWVSAEGVTIGDPDVYRSRVDSVAERTITLVLDTPNWSIPSG